MGFVAKPAADLVPRGRINGRRLPGFVPCRIGERIAAFAGPLVHQRQPIADVLRVGGDGGAVVRRPRRIGGRQTVQRSQQPAITGVQHEAALAGRAVHAGGKEQ